MLVVDFTKNNKLLTEAGILSALGSWTKSILRHMYGKDVKMVGDINSVADLANIISEDEEPNFVIRGKYRDVKAYATAIVREKEYLDAVVKSNSERPENISVYIHVPFCPQICHFCGCISEFHLYHMIMRLRSLKFYFI